MQMEAVQWYDRKRSRSSHSCSCTYSASRLEDSTRQGLALSFQMESTQYFGGEGYARYVTVAVSKKDFWARKVKYSVFVMVSIFNDI
jgi:hypothetical protein